MVKKKYEKGNIKILIIRHLDISFCINKVKRLTFLQEMFGNARITPKEFSKRTTDIIR